MFNKDNLFKLAHQKVSQQDERKETSNSKNPKRNLKRKLEREFAKVSINANAEKRAKRDRKKKKRGKRQTKRSKSPKDCHDSGEDTDILVPSDSDMTIDVTTQSDEFPPLIRQDAVASTYLLKPKPLPKGMENPQ